MPSSFHPTELPEVVVIEHRVFEDERGAFAEMMKAEELSDHGLPTVFVQDNVVCSRRGAVRGMHWQNPPHAQGKLVSVVAGRIWDVAVDIRAASQTFGRWVGVELSRWRSLWVPPGFAHGYQALVDDTVVVYRVTAPYAPASEAGFAWDDPTVGIRWPSTEVVLSPRDAALPSLSDADRPRSH